MEEEEEEEEKKQKMKRGARGGGGQHKNNTITTNTIDTVLCHRIIRALRNCPAATKRRSALFAAFLFMALIDRFNYFKKIKFSTGGIHIEQMNYEWPT